MPPRVKTRPYDSSRRRQEARKNRLAILDAAPRLFLVDGYARTSIAAVAKEARVSPDLVYRHDRTKALVLDLLNCAVTGELDAPKVLEPERFRAVLNEPERRRQLAMFAVDIAGRVESAQPIDHVIRSAGEVMLTSRRCTRRCTARDSGTAVDSSMMSPPTDHCAPVLRSRPRGGGLGARQPGDPSPAGRRHGLEPATNTPPGKRRSRGLLAQCARVDAVSAVPGCAGP